LAEIRGAHRDAGGANCGVLVNEMENPAEFYAEPSCPCGSNPVYITHSLHTLIIDRRGQLAADFEGNQFSARQLGDYLEALISGK